MFIFRLFSWTVKLLKLGVSDTICFFAFYRDAKPMEAACGFVLYYMETEHCLKALRTIGIRASKKKILTSRIYDTPGDKISFMKSE